MSPEETHVNQVIDVLDKIKTNALRTLKGKAIKFPKSRFQGVGILHFDTEKELLLKLEEEEAIRIEKGIDKDYVERGYQYVLLHCTDKFDDIYNSYISQKKEEQKDLVRVPLKSNMEIGQYQENYFKEANKILQSNAKRSMSLDMERIGRQVFLDNNTLKLYKSLSTEMKRIAEPMKTAANSVKMEYLNTLAEAAKGINTIASRSIMDNRLFESLDIFSKELKSLETIFSTISSFPKIPPLINEQIEHINKNVANTALLYEEYAGVSENESEEMVEIEDDKIAKLEEQVKTLHQEIFDLRSLLANNSEISDESMISYAGISVSTSFCTLSYKDKTIEISPNCRPMMFLMYLLKQKGGVADSDRLAELLDIPGYKQDPTKMKYLKKDLKKYLRKQRLSERYSEEINTKIFSIRRTGYKIGA